MLKYSTGRTASRYRDVTIRPRNGFHDLLGLCLLSCLGDNPGEGLGHWFEAILLHQYHTCDTTAWADQTRLSLVSFSQIYIPTQTSLAMASEVEFARCAPASPSFRRLHARRGHGGGANSLIRHLGLKAPRDQHSKNRAS